MLKPINHRLGSFPLAGQLFNTSIDKHVDFSPMRGTSLHVTTLLLVPVYLVHSGFLPLLRFSLSSLATSLPWSKSLSLYDRADLHFIDPFQFDLPITYVAADPPWWPIESDGAYLALDKGS